MEKQTACSPGSLITNSTLAIFDMAQTLSLSIMIVLSSNQGDFVHVGSGIRSHLSTPPHPAPSTLPPHHHYPLFPQHLLSCGLSRECPWTRSDLAASPQSDVIRLWKKVEKTHTHTLTSSALSRGWRGVQMEWLCSANVFDIFASIRALVSARPRRQSWMVAFAVVRSGENFHA